MDIFYVTETKEEKIIRTSFCIVLLFVPPCCWYIYFLFLIISFAIFTNRDLKKIFFHWLVIFFPFAYHRSSVTGFRLRGTWKKNYCVHAIIITTTTKKSESKKYRLGMIFFHYWLFFCLFNFCLIYDRKNAKNAK